MKKLHFLLLPLLTIVALFATSCTGDSTIETYYSTKLSVKIQGNTYTTADDVTYVVRSYSENGTNKVDIVVPSYKLTGTPMGDMTIGGYTVNGVCQIPGKSGNYSRDYSEDGLTMSFTVRGKTGTYNLNSGNEAITAVMSGADINITNIFQPEGMPMVITTYFNTSLDE